MKLPHVLDALAAYGIHDRPTWETLSRVLRDSGDLSKTKRGRGAEHVGPRDLATLLMAGMAASSAASAPERVRLFRSLRGVWDANSTTAGLGLGQGKERITIPRTLSTMRLVLTGGPGFGGSLENLMRHGPALDDELHRYAGRMVKPLVGISSPEDIAFTKRHVLSFDLQFNLPGFDAELRFFERKVDPEATDNYRLSETTGAEYKVRFHEDRLKPLRSGPHEEGWYGGCRIHGPALIALSQLCQDGTEAEA